MLINDKIAGNIMYIYAYAAVYFVNFTTIFAMKMVMVMLASNFITSAFARNFYGFKNAVFSEKFYTAINSGYA